MNERIKELALQAGLTGDFAANTEYATPIPISDEEQKFAELIIKECLYTIQIGIIRNGHAPENMRSHKHLTDIANRFGIAFPIDYYPDRDKQ